MKTPLIPPLINLPEKLYPENISTNIVDIFALKRNKAREYLVKQITKIHFDL